MTLTCLLFVPKLLTHYRDIHFIKKTDLVLQGICLASGILMGINIMVLHFSLPDTLISVSDVHILIALFITSAHIIGLTFLTQQPRYFYLLFIPSTVPLIIGQFTHSQITQLPFYFAYNLAFVATLLCAYATQRNYQKFLNYYLKINNLFK